jgi:4-carboxymuconolactone decarboxylase
MGASASHAGDAREPVADVVLDASFDPSFARAIQLLADLADADGALDAIDKHLLRIALTALSDPSRTRATAERALGSGVTTEQIRAVALALFLSRGVRPARAALESVDSATSPGEARDVIPVAREDILAEFAAAFGEIPERVRLLERHAPDGLEAYHRMRAAVLRDGPLAPRVGELVLFAVNAAEHRGDFAAVHARGARRCGAGDAELVEAGLMAVPYGGVAAWLAAAEAITTTAEAPGGS